MGVSAIVRARADWVRILEAIYAPIADDTDWARGVVQGMKDVFHCTDGSGLMIFGHDRECESGRVLLNVGDGAAANIDAAQFQAAAFEPVVLRAFFYPPAIVTTHSEIDVTLGPEMRDLVERQRSTFGYVDNLGIVVHPDPGVAVVFYSALPRRGSPTKHERHRLSQVGLHLESAFRLRRRPESLKAVVTLDSPRVERLPGAPAAAALAAQARRIESSLARAGRGDHDAALGLWTALVAGRYSFLPRTENGRRRYLVLENAPDSQAMRALSPREIDVLTMAARGMSTKLVAYGLGLSPATVSSSLLRSAAKLGLATRIELLRLAATITRDPRARAMPATITGAENDILELLRQGLSNVEIARLRSRSVRTIANQVASLLRKTKSASRRALVADSSPQPDVSER